MKNPGRFFVFWLLLFSAFFVAVGGAVWLTSRDSNPPPAGEHPVSRVAEVTSPLRNWYEIDFGEGEKQKTLKISPSKLRIETSGDQRRATISIDKSNISLKLPTDFEIRGGDVLLSVTFAAFMFSSVWGGVCYIFASYTSRG